MGYRDDLEMPRRASEFKAWSETVRAEHAANLDYLNRFIPEFQSLLKRSLPSGPVGTWMLIPQLIRPLRDLADLNQGAAAAASRAWYRMEEKVLNPRTVNAPFDITT